MAMVLAALRRLSVWDQTPNTVGCWLGVAFLLGLCLPRSARLPVALLSLGALAFTQSRSALLLCLLVFLVLRLRDKAGPTPAVAAGWVLGALAAGAACAAFTGRLAWDSLARSAALRLEMANAALIRAVEKNLYALEPGLGLARDASLRYQMNFTLEQMDLLTRPLSALFQLLTEVPLFFGALLLVVMLSPAFAFLLSARGGASCDDSGLAPRLLGQVPACAAFVTGCALFNDLNQDGAGRFLLGLMALASLVWMVLRFRQAGRRSVLFPATCAGAAVFAALLWGFCLYQWNLHALGISCWVLGKRELADGVAYHWSGGSPVKGHVLILSQAPEDLLSIRCAAESCRSLGQGWGVAQVRSSRLSLEPLLTDFQNGPLRVIVVDGWLPAALKARLGGTNDRFLIINPSEMNLVRESTDARVSFLVTPEYFARFELLASEYAVPCVRSNDLASDIASFLNK